MLSADEDALICDLAETYGIFDYRALPARTLATLAVGLREDSRIKMHLIGAKIPRKDLLLAAIVDRLSLLVWFNTEDGRNGVNRPPSVLGSIFGNESADNVEAFDTADAYEAEWARITGVTHGG
jgi:hypothetical protein